ncbi:hypothetical protein IL306_001513 [Fusarium sp. DS 682]|nr:hypothetical protein IL306_001513 [Fusarium sp. DS 682]
MVSSLDSFENAKTPEDTTMNDHGLDSAFGFFYALENVRNNSPESLIGAWDPQAVIKWRNEIAELASSGEMVHDQEAEIFFQKAPSVAESDGALSDMTSKPSRVSLSSLCLLASDANMKPQAEVEEALAHPEAPVIQGYQPLMALAKCESIIRSTHIDTMAKAKYAPEIQPCMSRNEVIFDEWDRADAVAFANKQRKDEDAAHRRRLKIYRAVEKHIVEGGRYAVKIKREASEAYRLCRHLDNEYERMRREIHRFSEACGHEHTDNLQDAIALIRKTEKEEGITYKKYEQFESPGLESPESAMAAELGCDYHDFAADHVDKTVDPTSEFF